MTRSLTSSLSSTISFPELRGGDGDGEIDVVNDGTGTDDTSTATASTTETETSTETTTGKKILLRVRLADGSIERIEIDENKIDCLTLNDILKPFHVPDDSTIQIGGKGKGGKGGGGGIEGTETLQTLDVKHGSMITIIPSPKVKNTADIDNRFSRLAAANAKKKAATASLSSNNANWNPYPDLAKNYDELLLKTKTKRSSRTSLSYSDISKLQSALHIVEPQKEGPILRVYMCRISAERFYSNGITKSKPIAAPASSSSSSSLSKKKKKQQSQQQQQQTNYNCRVGLLLGTIQKERVDKPESLGLTKKKARTSLSSQTSDSDYCTVGKVHAVYEPPSQQPPNDTLYDINKAKQLISSGQQSERVLLISKYLGLIPIGWIFSYNDERLKGKRDQTSDKKLGNNDPQALFGLDIALGGTLKIQNMKNQNMMMKASKDEKKKKEEVDDETNEDGNKFVTLSMDATTGATEAFQLSDVSVQMIYEDMFENVLDAAAKTTTATQNNVNTNPPIVPMRHEILIDGKETKQLDSVLCLVNTAMLSHVGHYSGGSGSKGGNSIKKSNGSLTNKTKKSLLKALEAGDGDGEFLELLSDFNVLVGLDQLLLSGSHNTGSGSNDNDNDIKMVCGLVRKWSRGQKQTTKIDSKLKRKLMTYLGS
jgi:hypothetical protein